EDLPDLINHIIDKINDDYGRNVAGVSADSIDYLAAYHWPGNIRELENVIGRAMIYMGINEDIIQNRHIPELNPITAEPGDEPLAGNNYRPLHEVMNQYEKKYIWSMYKRNNYNKTKTAKELDISIRSLYYKM